MRKKIPSSSAAENSIGAWRDFLPDSQWKARLTISGVLWRFLPRASNYLLSEEGSSKEEEWWEKHPVGVISALFQGDFVQSTVDIQRRKNSVPGGTSIILANLLYLAFHRKAFTPGAESFHFSGIDLMQSFGTLLASIDKTLETSAIDSMNAIHRGIDSACPI